MAKCAEILWVETIKRYAMQPTTAGYIPKGLMISLEESPGPWSGEL
jgi:hypothetical protein